MSEALPEPRWMVVANVKVLTDHGTGGGDKEVGLKHFSPGTKVYIGLPMHDRAEVLGRHRGGSRLVSLVVQLRHLENFRIRLVYELKVLKVWSLPKLSEADAKDVFERAVAGSRWSEPDAQTS